MFKGFNWRAYLLLAAAAVLVWSAVDVAAQRTTGRNTRSGRTSGGGFGGGGGLGTSGTRDYPSPGTIGEAMISSDPETRRIIVITDEETAQHISQVVTNLDRPKPQVLIKVVFLEVTYRDGLDLGVEGQYRKNIGNNTTGAVSQLFGLGQQGTQPTLPFTTQTGSGIYQILGSDFQVTLRAIAEAGRLEVLSKPSILARNNQQATIMVGQQVPLITNVRFDTIGNQINTVQYQDVGIILRVTPFITSDGMVEMIVSPEISSLSGTTIPISSGANGTVGAPIIDRRSADTVVVTPDGQTVVIGGLMESNKQRTDSKVPLLGDIPLLGNLFKRKLKQDLKTELLIFLTPHIVADPTQLAGISKSEQAKSQLAPKAFSEQELSRFLDGLPQKQEGQTQPPPAKGNEPAGRTNGRK